jgi:hypothetical protein
MRMQARVIRRNSYRTFNDAVSLLSYNNQPLSRIFADTSLESNANRAVSIIPIHPRKPRGAHSWMSQQNVPRSPTLHQRHDGAPLSGRRRSAEWHDSLLARESQKIFEIWSTGTGIRKIRLASRGFGPSGLPDVLSGSAASLPSAQ